MNKKGFTLVELLAIILILGIIAMIAAPNISKQISNTEKNEQKILVKRVVNASKIYASKYFADKLVNGDDVYFSIDDMLQDGVLTLNDDECSGNRTDNFEFNISDIEATVENLCN